MGIKKIKVVTVLIFLFCFTILTGGFISERAYAISNYTSPKISCSAYNSANIFTQSGYKGQCTWFVWGRTLEKLSIKLNSNFYGNARTWWNENTYPKGQTPTANSIGVFSAGSTGHVVFIEDVVGNTVYFNEGNFHRIKNYDGALESLSISAFKSRSGQGNFLGFVYLKSSPSNNKSSYSNNAILSIKSNTWAQIQDANGKIILGKRVQFGSSIIVLSIDYYKHLAFIEYKTSSGVYQGYINNYPSIKYTYQGQWKNGSTGEIVYDENGNNIGYLNPRETATPLYRKNGRICVVYNTSKGTNTKSGFVIYNGGFYKF